MLTVKEVAEKMKVTKVTVYRWIKNKQIKVIRIGGTIRIPESELTLKRKEANK